MTAPIAGTQAPGFYRHKVGSYEVTVVSDGTLTLDATIFTGDEAGAEKLLRDAHLPKMGFTTPLNTWLINTGQKLILVDAGGGTHFAPSVGRLPQNLAAAGVSPSAIDAVVITHPHPDHIPGVITSDHKMLFPNATLYVNENDHAFWTSAEIRGKAPEEFRGFFDLAVNAIKPYAAAGKLSLYKDGAEFAPGVPRGRLLRPHRRPQHGAGVAAGRRFPHLRRHRALPGAAISRSGTLGGVRHRSAGGARQPQAGARHGDDRSPVVLRRPPAVPGARPRHQIRQRLCLRAGDSRSEV